MISAEFLKKSFSTATGFLTNYDFALPLAQWRSQRKDDFSPITMPPVKLDETEDDASIPQQFAKEVHLRAPGREAVCMTQRKLLFNVGLSLLLCTLGMNADEKPTSMAVAAAAVEANMKTPEGKAYDAQFGRDLAKKYPPVMKTCKDKAEGDIRSFDMLVRLEKDGAVKEVLLHPATRISQCLREAILKDTFSPPPKAAHWVDIHVDVKR